VSDIFDGGGVGATAPSEQFGGMLSQPPLSPAVDRPAPLPTFAEPVAAEPVSVEPELDPNAPGMLERKLLQFGLVTMDQLGEAMREEAATGRPVAAILIERGWVTQEQIAQLLEPAPPLAAAPAPTPEPPPFLAEVPQQPPAPEPVPVPVPVPVVPPPPPPAPEPVAEVVPVAPEPILAVPAPVVEPEPAPVPPLAAPSSLAFHMYIRLSTGERIDANTFTNLNDARDYAEDLVKKLSSNSHVWPSFGGRYIRPEAIISIDVEAAPV
jgi:hypothetical protein